MIIVIGPQSGDVIYDSPPGNSKLYFTLSQKNPAVGRGGLVVERWSDNRLDSATVGSNLRQGMIYQLLSS